MNAYIIWLGATILWAFAIVGGFLFLIGSYEGVRDILEVLR